MNQLLFISHNIWVILISGESNWSWHSPCRVFRWFLSIVMQASIIWILTRITWFQICYFTMPKQKGSSFPRPGKYFQLQSYSHHSQLILIYISAFRLWIIINLGILCTWYEDCFWNWRCSSWSCLETRLISNIFPKKSIFGNLFWNHHKWQNVKQQSLNNSMYQKLLSMWTAQRKNATSNARMEMFQHLYGQMERKFQKVLSSVKEDQTGSHEQVKSHVRNNVIFLNKLIKKSSFIES